jgi:hypothetical protein
MTSLHTSDRLGYTRRQRAAGSFEHARLYDTAIWQSLYTLDGMRDRAADRFKQRWQRANHRRRRAASVGRSPRLGTQDRYTLKEREALLDVALIGGDALLVTLTGTFDDNGELADTELAWWGVAAGIEGTTLGPAVPADTACTVTKRIDLITESPVG